LVEEAALRRSIAVAATLGDMKRFLRLSEQYVRVYLHSPYAGQFADAFVAGVVALNATIDRQGVVDIAALMEPDQEKVIYLRIARRAAIDGFIDLAAFAATHAEGVEDDPRAELYSSLSSVTSGTVEDVLEKLAGIDRARLSANDQQLLDAAGAITREMSVAPAGTKAAGAATEPAEVRSVGPEPLAPAHDNAVPADHQPAQLPVETVSAPTEQSRSRGPSKAVDATVEQAQAMVAATRAKLADIDKLLGDMPE
jgi:chemotaxis protein MotC